MLFEKYSSNNSGAYVSVDVSICICTFKRLKGIEACLHSIIRLDRPDVNIEVIVVDNDSQGSARIIIEGVAKGSFWPVRYFIEEASGVSFARNRCLLESRGRLIAFIDDDEEVSRTWLVNMLSTASMYQADAVLGPVVARFEHQVSTWLKDSRAFDRPRFRTGALLHWGNGRTGNMLCQGDLMRATGGFDVRLARLGGEDLRFFLELSRRFNAKLVWCDEAEVHELVPPLRTTFRYVFDRALNGGRSMVRIQADAWGHHQYAYWFIRGLLAFSLHTFAALAAVFYSKGRAVDFSRKAAGDLGKMFALIPDRTARYGQG